MSTHAILQEIYEADATIPDPGAGGTIRVDRSPGIVELVTATAEGRILPDPVSSGILLTLYSKTINTQCLVVADTAIDGTNNRLTFDADGETLVLVSVSDGSGGFKWWMLVNVGSVGLSS